MKKNKHDLKKQQVDDQKKYIQSTDILEKDHKTKEQYIVDEHNDLLADLQKKYSEKLYKMKDQLELRTRVEIHEL